MNGPLDKLHYQYRFRQLMEAKQNSRFWKLLLRLLRRQQPLLSQSPVCFYKKITLKTLKKNQNNTLINFKHIQVLSSSVRSFAIWGFLLKQFLKTILWFLERNTINPFSWLHNHNLASQIVIEWVAKSCSFFIQILHITPISRNNVVSYVPFIRMSPNFSSIFSE